MCPRSQSGTHIAHTSVPLGMSFLRRIVTVPHIDHIGPLHTVGTQHNVNVAAYRGSFWLVATRGQWCFSLAQN